MKTYSLNGLDALENHNFDSIIDVRSEDEFRADCLPDAINMPVLNKSERAFIGTIYKKKSPFKARQEGAQLVAQNTSAHISSYLLKKEADWRPLIYCWRGGQRSQAFATILSMIGWDVHVLEGGYKSYRRHIYDFLYNNIVAYNLILIDGNTGSAKTEILRQAHIMGAQIVDLECLANHRGSVFGKMPFSQPTQRKFESLLAEKLTKLNPQKPIFIEAESSKIGKILIPQSLWKAMCSAPRIFISAPLDARVRYILGKYHSLKHNGLFVENALAYLTRFHAKATVERWRAHYNSGAFEMLVKSLIKDHYDRAYQKASARHSPHILQILEAQNLDKKEITMIAQKLCASSS